MSVIWVKSTVCGVDSGSTTMPVIAGERDGVDSHLVAQELAAGILHADDDGAVIDDVVAAATGNRATNPTQQAQRGGARRARSVRTKVI